jgi:hypothetical protein
MLGISSVLSLRLDCDVKNRGNLPVTSYRASVMSLEASDHNLFGSGQS